MKEKNYQIEEKRGQEKGGRTISGISIHPTISNLNMKIIQKIKKAKRFNVQSKLSNDKHFTKF